MRNPPCSSIYSEKTASCRSSPQKGEGTASEPVEQLRYIYTPKAAEMVIDSYGTFTVREISVERLWLEGVTGSLDLRFHADTDAVPERERAAGLPHNGQKR